MDRFVPVEMVRELKRKNYDPCRSKYDEAYETVKESIAHSIIMAAKNNLNGCAMTVRNGIWKDAIIEHLMELGYDCIPLHNTSEFQILW